MKTVLLKKGIAQFSFIFILLLVVSRVTAQSSDGFVFRDPVLQTGHGLQKGAVYLFKNVKTGIDATVTIEDLVNGAVVKKIDDNSNDLGYTDAFQPEIQSGGLGESYAIFTIRFINGTTGNAETIKSVQATALDIDGNLSLKEFGEVNMNGGAATYMGGTLEILLKSLPIVNTVLNQFRADNILGIEKDGIDTTAKGNMYTVSKGDVSAFTVKYGATSLSTSKSNRQYSMYVKGFAYPNQVTLPLKLVSFTATLGNDAVNLKWVTATEKNVSHFVLEKSYDGKNFSDAANVFAFGNTTQDMSYAYADNTGLVKSNVLYYRLRCVDNDEKFMYSEVRIIRLNQSETDMTVSAYPNPFVNELRATLPYHLQGRAMKIELFNTGGQLIKMKTVATASQTETISTSELERGFYVMRITAGSEKMQQKVIKN